MQATAHPVRRGAHLDTMLDQRCLGVLQPAPWQRKLAHSSMWAEGLRLTRVLRHHTGCVNTLEWYDAQGTKLLSSGDDLKVVLWDATRDYAMAGHFRTGHSANVFCVKRVPGQDALLTCGMDGDVRLADLIHQADGSIVPRVELLSRSPGDMALKIEFLPEAPSSFLVTHQDGNICLTDLRTARRPGLAGDAPEQTVVALDMMVYSLCFDPCNPHQFVASCGSSFVHQYDLRMQGRPYSQPVKYWVDGALPGLSTEQPDLPSFRRHVTDVHFGASGNLLVNYSGHDVVLLSGSVVDQNGMGSHVLQRFTGRVNEETFLKEVRFLGSGEKYVCTGSDSGEVFIWETASGRLTSRIAADRLVVNGVAPHPFLPTLACCGIDSEPKILEYRGGCGLLEPDLLKEIHNSTSLSFRMRHNSAPEIVDSAEARVRVDGASFLRQEGNTFFRAKRIADALRTYARAQDHLRYCPPTLAERAARDTERLLLLLNFAACYGADSDWDMCVRSCNRALSIDPASIKALYRRAKAYYHLRRFAEALADVDRALALNPPLDDVTPLQALRQQLINKHGGA